MLFRFSFGNDKIGYLLRIVAKYFMEQSFPSLLLKEVILKNLYIVDDISCGGI